MINVGIFWVINKQIYYRIESKKQEEINKELIAPLGIIDSTYGHFIEWEKKEKFLFLNDDFSTYPRGRVLFNIKKNVDKSRFIYYNVTVYRNAPLIVPLITQRVCENLFKSKEKTK